jgi:hypothetical protein
MKKLIILSAALSIFPGGAFASIVGIDFSEFNSNVNSPLITNGLSLGGVVFQFALAGIPGAANDSTYGGNAANSTGADAAFITGDYLFSGANSYQNPADPSDPTDQVFDGGGKITLTFDSPTSYLQLGAALGGDYGPQNALVGLYDSNGNSLTIPGLTLPLLFAMDSNPSACDPTDPNLPCSISEGTFTYSGPAFSSVTIDFAGTGAQVFAIDNLTFDAPDVPEPGTNGMLLLGTVAVLARRKLRYQS